MEIKEAEAILANWNPPFVTWEDLYVVGPKQGSLTALLAPGSLLRKGTQRPEPITEWWAVINKCGPDRTPLYRPLKELTVSDGMEVRDATPQPVSG